ncbi:MAG: hypothetical protein N2036_11720 [Bryobacteraceae bacterium]|nr:hypothetical protein [Bryobacteraceae bacterium]
MEIQEGAGAVVPGGALSSRRFTVVVKDEMGQPVPGATVHFRLPSEGPTGTFSSGLRSESTLTDSRGMATVYGIQWGSQPGKLEISVLASNGDRKGTAAIPVEVSRHAVVTREDRSNPGFKAPSSGRKWLLLALVGAGAAAGVGMAGKGGGKATVYQPPAVVVVPPSIGTPTITVGKP